MGAGFVLAPIFSCSETPPLAYTLLPPSTELEAVNQMLGSIGQAPVNTLTVSGVPDVLDAVSLLRSTLRDVQAAGWSWNTDRNYSLSPQTNGTVPIPTGALEVDPEDNTTNVVVRRHLPSGNLCLYDADAQNFTFTDAVPCRVVWGFPFDDIPQAARTFVAISAARKFQAQRVTSAPLDSYNEEDQKQAWALLQRIERRTRDTNSFRANAQSQKALRRRF